MIERIQKLKNIKPIVKSSLILGLLTVLIKILGYSEKLALAYYFGTSYEIDVYNVVIAITFSIFFLFREIIEPGFLHVFMRAFHRGDKTGAWQLFRIFFILISLLTVGFTVICLTFPTQVMNIFAPGFSAEKEALAKSLLKIIIPATIFLSLSTLTNITLNAQKRFALPNVGEIIFKIAIIAFLLLFYNKIGIYSVAIGFIIGAAMKLSFHLLLLYKDIVKERSHQISAYILETWRLTWPLLIGVTFSQISTLIDNVFASYQEEGAISALSYAKKLVDLPILIFPYILSVVIFPYFSELSLTKEKDKSTALLSKSLAWITIIFLPLSVFFFMFSHELTAIVFQRGAFDHESTSLTSLPLKYYSMGMVFFAIETVLVIFYFANADTKTPIWIGIISVVENIFLTVLFLNIFGYSGIALSLVLSKATKNLILLILLRKMIVINYRKVFTFAIKVFAASLLTGLGMIIFREAIPFSANTFGTRLLLLLMMFSFCAILYTTYLALFKIKKEIL